VSPWKGDSTSACTDAVNPRFARVDFRSVQFAAKKADGQATILRLRGFEVITPEGWEPDIWTMVLSTNTIVWIELGFPKLLV
jgi:hypothetical protein